MAKNDQWLNRIKCITEESPDQLLANPANFRIHPKGQQDALSGVLNDVGFVTGVIQNDTTGHIIDGHLRCEIAISKGQQTIPVIHVELSEAEEKEILATFDPIGAMAAADKEKLDSLLREVQSSEEAVQKMIAELRKEHRIDDMRKDLQEEKKKIINVPGELALSAEEQERFKDKSKIIVAFSGGKDSSVALLWAVKNFPAQNVHACFVDVGVEFPGMALHTKQIARSLGCQYHLVKPKQDFFITLEEMGWPNFRFPWCQHKVLYPALDLIYPEIGSPEEILAIGGGSQKEATPLSNKTQSKQIQGYDHYFPVYGWSKEQEEEEINKSGIQLWWGYALGFPRTACWMCPGGRQVFYSTLRKWFPGLFRHLMEWEKKIGLGAWQGGSAQGPTKSFKDLADRGEKKLPELEIPEDL